jgi:hypothetical protein
MCLSLGSTGMPCHGIRETYMRRELGRFSINYLVTNKSSPTVTPKRSRISSLKFKSKTSSDKNKTMNDHIIDQLDFKIHENFTYH